MADEPCESEAERGVDSSEQVLELKAESLRVKYNLPLRGYEDTYKCNERTIKRWIARGKESSPPDLPPLDEPRRMPAWWALHYRHKCPEALTIAAVAAGWSPETSVVDQVPAPAGEALPSPPPAGAVFEEIPSALSGYAEMLERARRAEAVTGGEFERLNAVQGDQRDEAKIAAARKAWLDNAKLLRELDRDANEILESQGHSMSRAAVLKILAEMHGPVLNGMRSILRKIWSQLKLAESLAEGDRIYQAEVDRVCSRLIDSDFMAHE